MNSKKVKINVLFKYWIILSLSLVFLIIIVGGLTRLTDSGLSIIEWELIKGILPPMSENSWSLYFEKYKTIPQYKLLNDNMTIEEFKVIFYWEYFHRILGRIIGLFFLIPLIFFYLTKKINQEYLKNCFTILILIILQGSVGWYMVKSGLVNDVTVSHYRLSIHLSIAIIIISMLFWLLINVFSNENNKFIKFKIKFIPYQFLLILIFFQIIIGAFVSGLDAGMIYQSWPLMGTSFFPDDIILNNFSLIDFDNHSLVQFYHRTLAYIIFIYSLILGIKIYRDKIESIYVPLIIFISTLLIQVILGIITLISGINIYLASLHQITSVLLIFSALNLYYLSPK